MNVVTFIMDSVLNTLWQSALVVGTVWAGLKFSPARVNAATRYVIWWITLVAVLTLPWIHRASPASEHTQRPVEPRSSARVAGRGRRSIRATCSGCACYCDESTHRHMATVGLRNLVVGVRVACLSDGAQLLLLARDKEASHF